ncbi:MAG: HEAT repeat domain-containing protein [Planctomycetota bacterium]
MRLQAIIPLTLAVLTGCMSTTTSDQSYVKANSVVAAEITRRISDIQYQHRNDLLDNLMWLAQSGEQAIPYLLDAMHHQEPKVRANAAWVLGRIKDRRVIPELETAANDQNQTVRLEIARTLVTLGDIKYAPALIEGLDSDRPAVRYNCHQALKEASGRDFGYDHLAESEVDRQRATLRWRQWWGEQFQDPWFASSYAQAHGFDANDTGRPAMPSPAPMTETAPQTPPSDGNR